MVSTSATSPPHAHDSTPGTDGLGYSWASAAAARPVTLDDVAEEAKLGGSLPHSLHASRTVCVPKQELADPGDARPTADTLWQLTMMTTGEKLIARHINGVLSAVATRHSSRHSAASFPTAGSPRMAAWQRCLLAPVAPQPPSCSTLPTPSWHYPTTGVSRTCVGCACETV